MKVSIPYRPPKEDITVPGRIKTEVKFSLLTVLSESMTGWRIDPGQVSEQEVVEPPKSKILLKAISKFNEK